MRGGDENIYHHRCNSLRFLGSLVRRPLHNASPRILQDVKLSFRRRREFYGQILLCLQMLNIFQLRIRLLPDPPVEEVL